MSHIEDHQQEDAIPVETTTQESSPETETSTVQAEPVTTDAAFTEEGQTDKVPEINRIAERARKAEQELAALKAAQSAQPAAPADPNADAIKAQLKSMGFVTREEQVAELERRDADVRVDQELSSLESKYSGKDGRPKFDRSKVLQYAIDNGIGKAEVAYKAMYEKSLLDWHVQQAVTKTRGVKTEGSDGSGSTEVGTTAEDLKQAIRQGDRSAIKSYISRFTRGGQ